MHRDHKIFIQAIEDKKKVIIKLRDDETSGTFTKVCRPLFYIPSKNPDDCAQYYFWHGEQGKKGNIFWATPKQILHIGPTQESFDPAGFKLVHDEELPSSDSQSSDSLEHAQ
jgi:hypothetical protein